MLAERRRGRWVAGFEGLAGAADMTLTGAAQAARPYVAVVVAAA